MPLDPDELFAAGDAYAAQVKTQKRNGTGHGSTTDGSFADLFQQVPEGKRNATLTRFVGYLRQKRMDYPAGLFMANAWNEQYCFPPLDSQEVENLVSRAWVEWIEGDEPDATPEDFQPKSEPLQRTSLRDRIIRFRDVPFPPAEMPYQWGPYLNKSAVHWMTARTGAGKSTLTYNIMCAMAEGRTLWGIESEPTRILYCDLESGQIGRSLKIQRLYMDRRPDIPLHFMETVSLPLESNELLSIVKGEGYEFIVFDTARRCFSVKDENDNAEFYNKIAPTLDALKAISVGSLTLGHPAKNGNNSARGAGAQEDAGDVNLSLTMHKGETTDADAIVKLSITKNRILGLGHPPLFLQRIGGDQFEIANVTDEERAESALMVKVERVQQATEDLLQRGEPTTVRAIAAYAKISTRDVTEVKKFLSGATV